MGDVVIGQEVEWDEESCIWVHYFWDEWEPGSQNQPIPPPYEGGGGPFYPSPDPREPTIDTMPDGDDHLCDEQYDGKCFIKLEVIDSIRIADSVDAYLRPLGQIADTLQRRECDSLRTWLNFARANMELVVWRGRTDGYNPAKQPQDAQVWNLGTRQSPRPFHIDPRVLDSATTPAGKRRLLKSLLHEPAHGIGNSDHSDNLSEVAAGYPNDPYFRILHSTSSPCID